MTHSYVRHVSSICVTWRVHKCDMTHPYVWHDSFTHGHITSRPSVLQISPTEGFPCPFPREILGFPKFSFPQAPSSWIPCSEIVLVQRKNSEIPKIPLDMDKGSPHLNIRNAKKYKSFKCVTWFIHMCCMIRSNVWHDLFIYVIWLIHLWTCNVTT